MSDDMRKTGWLKTVGQWFEKRTAAGEAMKHMADHPVPKNTASWWYVFGSGTMVALIVQIVTGICLALVYTPSADEAYASLLYLNFEQPLGWFLRGIHYWGSNVMIALMSIHLIQVFLFGAFKFPRELTWVVGVILFLCTLGMAFTGQVLRWDQDAYWGLGIGVSIVGRLPLIGAQMADLVMGGPIIGAATLTRFFSLHVFVIPGLLLVFLGIHLLMVFRLGINEWPMPGRLVHRDTYENKYKDLLKNKGTSFWPSVIAKDMAFAGIVIIVIVLLAAFIGPKNPNGIPDPTIINTMPVPDFYFLPMFAIFALLPPSWEEVLVLGLPPVAIAFLMFFPFFFPYGEKSWKRRPLSVICTK